MEDSRPVFEVNSDGDYLAARGMGHGEVEFFGPSEKVAIARRAADEKLEVRFIWGVRKLVAGWDSEEGILAALLATAPGKCYVREVPEDLLETLHKLADLRAGEVN